MTDIHVMTYGDHHGTSIWGVYSSHDEALRHVLEPFAWMSNCYGDLGDPRPFKMTSGPYFRHGGRWVQISPFVVDAQGGSTWFAEKGFPTSQGTPQWDIGRLGDHAD